MSETESATTDTNATASVDAPNEAVVEVTEVLTGQPEAKAAEAETKTDAVKDGDQKPEGEKPEEKAKSDVPESYEFKIPEGMAIDEALVESFSPLAKELGLTQDKAQQLVDFYAKQEAGRAEVWTQTQATWAQETKADKEIGGDAFDKNVAIANQAVSKFGSPEFVKALKDTGVANHPEFVRFCLRVGKAISEDTVATGAQGGGDRSAADVLFPTMAH